LPFPLLNMGLKLDEAGETADPFKAFFDVLEVELEIESEGFSNVKRPNLPAEPPPLAWAAFPFATPIGKAGILGRSGTFLPRLRLDRLFPVPARPSVFKLVPLPL